MSAVIDDVDMIRVLNDKFRSTFIGGVVHLDTAIVDMPWQAQETICDIVRTYSLFDDREHREGEFGFDGERYSFIILYHRRGMSDEIPDPSNPRTTLRVLHIRKHDPSEDYT